MQFVKTKLRYIIRLQKNESFTTQLSRFCDEEKITSAFFYGVGAFLSAELGFYDLDKRQYHFKKFDKTMELVSLAGNITFVDNKPFIHAHCVLSDENYECRGGHLKDAIVGGTVEIYLFSEDLGLKREFDSETGLKLINCKAE